MATSPADRIRVGLVFGGESVEHEVSLVSARGIAAGFDDARFEVVPLAVSPEGRWLSPELSARFLDDGRARAVPLPGEDDGVRMLVGPGGEGLLRCDAGGRVRQFALDVVFPIIHGWGGEDGRLQGLLDLAGLRYVGAGVTGSAVAMDKAVARSLAERAGLDLAPWRCIEEPAYRSDPNGRVRELARELGMPVFVKPANGGSSVGITKVSSEDGLPAALETAFGHDRRVLVEHGIDAREIECAVLGADAPEASVPGEIVPGAEFYTYDDKYKDGVARLLIPAPLEPDLAETVRAAACSAFRALGLSGMARVDFLLRRGDSRLLFNEANTLPGFTPISMYSKLWEATGLPYAALLARLVDLALERPVRPS